jgi:hypothetical protein
VCASQELSLCTPHAPYLLTSVSVSFFCGVVSSACLPAGLKGRNEVEFVGSAGPGILYCPNAPNVASKGARQRESESARERESESERASASAGAGEREWSAEIRTDKRDGFEG